MDKNVEIIDMNLNVEKNAGIEFIGAPSFWENGFKGQGNVVAVIDTGCDIRHEELKDNIIGFVNFTDDDNGEVDKVTDYAGHGTHVAGIIAGANKRRLIGIAPKTKLLILKAIGAKSISTTKVLIEAIRFAISWRGNNDEKVDIINLSLGTKEDNKELKEVIKQALDKNIFIAVASGNFGDGDESTNEILYPGYYEGVIQVGSVDSYLVPSSFSNTNQNIDFLSLGKSVYSTYPLNDFIRFSGTSMATPHITGAISLIICYFRKNHLPITQSSIYNYLVLKSCFLEGYTKRTQGNGVLKL